MIIWYTLKCIEYHVCDANTASYFYNILVMKNNNELYKLHTWIDNAASLWADTDIATGDRNVPNPLDLAAVRVMFTYVGLGIPISVG